MSPRSQRCAVAAAIIGVHAAGLWYVVQMRQLLDIAVRMNDQPLVYIRNFEPPLATSGSPKAPGTAGRAPSASHALPRQAATEGSSTAPSLPAIPSPEEWDEAAQDAAHDIVGQMARGEKRKCDDSPKPDSVLPKCRKHPGRFEWNEEPRRAGFENGLPYLRLGRCILVLGLIACPVGAAPAANGHLFGDLRDPDRDRSSVPDVAEINEPVDLAPRHRSVVIDPPEDRPAGSR